MLETWLFTGLQHFRRLSLGSLGAVGGAVTLALAGVLAGILAAALTLTVILAFAGVLGGVRRSLCHGGADVGGADGLSIEADSGTADETGESSSESDILKVLHLEGTPFFAGWAARTIPRGRWCRVNH